MSKNQKPTQASKEETKEDFNEDKNKDPKELSYASEKIAEIAELGKTRTTFMILYLASLICVLVFFSTPQYAEWSLTYMGYSNPSDLKAFTSYALTTYIVGGISFLGFLAYTLLKGAPQLNADMEVAQQLDHYLTFMKRRSGIFITLLIVFSAILVVVASPQYAKLVLDSLGQEVCKKMPAGVISKPNVKKFAEMAADF